MEEGIKIRNPHKGNFNKREFRAGLFALILAVVFPAAAKAQCKAVNNAFNAGEDITYELFFNWKFVWLKAGTARLTTIDTTFVTEPAYQIDLLAITNKGLDRIFKMRDTITAVISKQLEPVYFRKGAEEGRNYLVDEAWFSYKDGKSYVSQKRTRANGEVIETAQNDSRCIQNMLSILAQARSYHPENFEVGKKILFPMATGRKVDEQTLIYRGIENVKTDNATYRCLVFSLVEYETGRRGREKEVITFFVSDDNNHLPVRLDLYLNIGSAKAFLLNVSGNRYPLTSIVDKQ